MSNHIEAAFITFDGKYWMVQGENSGIVFGDAIDTRAQAVALAQEMQDNGDIAYFGIDE